MSRNKSGYDAVVDGIMKLPEIDGILTEYKERCNDPRLVGHSFEVMGGQVTGRFTFQFGPTPTLVNTDGKTVTDERKLKILTIRSGQTSVGEFRYPTDWFERAFMSLVEEAWGSRYKTYNCNKKESLSKAFFHLNTYDGRFPKLGDEPQKSMAKQIEDISATDDWQEEKVNFLENQSKNAIIAAMNKFPDVADEVFVTAMEEFIAERVIED